MWKDTMTKEQIKNNSQCNKIKSLFSEIYEQSLSVHEQFIVTNHFSNCSSCMKMYSEYATVIKLAGQLGDLPLPESVASKLRERIRQEIHCANN